MENNITGALPTKKTTKTQAVKTAQAKAYTEHYLSHKISDIPGSKIKSNTKVIDSIINRHKNFHKGDYNYNDSNDDLTAAAYLIVHETAIKYVNSDKYQNNFDFCKFASENLKFGLKNYIYKLNTKRLNGSLPDSDSVRKLYYQLPKEKKKQNNNKDKIDNKGYTKLSETTGIDLETVKTVDKTLTSYTKSGDQKLGEDGAQTIFSTIPDTKTSIEDSIINSNLISKIKKIKDEYTKTFSARDKDIVCSLKFLENKNISQLSKIYNLSGERVRQIAENKYKLIQEEIKKNLEFKI